MTTPAPSPDHSALRQIMNGLMRRYMQRVPDVETILAAMETEGLVSSREAIENDHIAFRTMGVPQLGIQSLEKIFLHHGYTRREPYHFAGKKLDAYWYSPPTPAFPRIFISELRVPDLSPKSQAIIYRYTNQVTQDPVDSLPLDDPAAVDAFLHSALWSLPTLAEYHHLAAESEYAAWVIYNRYYLNHFTISVHSLPEGANTVEEFNTFLVRQGIKLNNAGGVIKVSPDGLLLQSASVAQMVEAEFDGGEKELIPGSYVEFAERRPLPEFAHLPVSELGREHRRDGFEAGNADRIFESTFRAQVLR